MSAKFEAPRGTHDVLPAEQPLWQRATGEIERLCALYGYRKILTPTFEDTALFARTSGAGSDVVQKEMYTFSDRSDRSLTLRPEGTAPICRAYVEHGMHREPQPVKMFTIAPMFRYGAPQKGRFREHWQASVEAIGTDDPAIDAEVIQLYDTLLHRLGVSDYELELNSIGCRTCRPDYVQKLREWLEANSSRLDAATLEKAATSPLRALDNMSAKPQQVQEALADAHRSASRSATHVASISLQSGRHSTRTVFGTHPCRRSFAVSTTTPAPRGNSKDRGRARSRQSPAAVAMTA